MGDLVRRDDLWAAMGVRNLIVRQKTVDAVEVVRCRECEHLYRGGCMMTLEGQWNGDDWFCASGERRKEDG